MLTFFPALFHVTERSNINMIMRDGLQLGYQLNERQQYKRGRSDLHFSPFPPFDHRGQYFAKRLNGIKRDGYELAVFNVDPRLLAGCCRAACFNCERPHFDSAKSASKCQDHYVFLERIRWKTGIYYAQVLEHSKPIAFVKRAEMSSLMIANVVASDN